MKFLQLIEKFNDILEVLITWIIGILMTAMIVVVFSQVVLRYGFSMAPAWMEEFSRFLMIWIAYIGGALMFRKSGHIGVTILRNSLPFQVRRAMLFIDRIILSASFVLLSYYGTKLAMRYLTRTPITMNFPMFYVYMLFPIAFTLMFFFAIEDLTRLVVAPNKVGQLFRRFEDPELLLSGELDKMQAMQKGGTT